MSYLASKLQTATFKNNLLQRLNAAVYGTKFCPARENDLVKKQLVPPARQTKVPNRPSIVFDLAHQLKFTIAIANGLIDAHRKS